MIVLWLAREGTLCAESKSPVWATKMLIEAINKMLAYDPKIKVCIESKPNEPIDRSICGTMGHVMAISAATTDPSRVGGNLESAHAILAGLDPANEIGFALAMGKLMTVHLMTRTASATTRISPSASKIYALPSTRSRS